MTKTKGATAGLLMLCAIVISGCCDNRTYAVQLAVNVCKNHGGVYSLEDGHVVCNNGQWLDVPANGPRIDAAPVINRPKLCKLLATAYREQDELVSGWFDAAAAELKLCGIDMEHVEGARGIQS